ncbi:MAG: class I SAM-dependent methyltransferase [Gemmatimonadaceae bacterium]|nr:class I SAM-dependent methyltransferase [Gemmatimonadaceae bacterium]
MLPWITVGVLFCAVVVLALRLQRERWRRKERDPNMTWVIPSITLDALDPVFTAGPFGASLDTEVAFVGRGPISVPGGTSDAEAWVLAVLAKRARHCFEFGTCTGKTAYLWARNAPEDARVVTLTLGPSQQTAYLAGAGDTSEDTFFALQESAFETFLYTGTAYEPRVTQLYGDSKRFDESPWHEWADLVFVDGSHAKSYVESDSAKAMRIVRPGGLVLWHDYAGPRHAAGVYEALNALSARVPLRHVRGTTFVVWQRPHEVRAAV